jgi:serine protease Do
MKKSKLLILILAVVMAISSIGLFGCVQTVDSENVYVVKIEKTSSDENKDVYTVTYSDGTTTTFEVENGEDGAKGAKGDAGKDGKDGEDGKDLTIDEIYEKYLELHPNATYKQFLEAFLTVNTDGNAAAINRALLTSAKIYSEFIKVKSDKTDASIGAGSAVIYKIESDYTYFITNFHVVFDDEAVSGKEFARKLTCYLYGSEGGPYNTQKTDQDSYTIYDYGSYAIPCEYVGGAAMADIAVIRAQTSTVLAINPDVQAVVFADGYHVGETAIAIGNPESEGISVSEGIVSVDNERINLNVDGTSREFRSIRIDTALYHGNSGGGLYNTDGRLIGITNAGDVTDQNINYAIPVQIVKGAVENIMHYSALGENTVMKIKLGVTVTAKNSKYVYDESIGYGKIVEDIIVTEVADGSISASLGVSANDRIISLSINGTEYSFDRYFEIGDLLYYIKAGDKLSIKVERGGLIKTDLPTYTVKTSDVKAAE